MFVGLTTLTLIKHRAVPVEAVLFQAVEQRIRRSRLLPRRVHVLYAYLPFAIGRARVQVAGQSADQRAEIQRAGRWRGETADVVGMREKRGGALMMGWNDGGERAGETPAWAAC